MHVEKRLFRVASIFAVFFFFLVRAHLEEVCVLVVIDTQNVGEVNLVGRQEASDKAMDEHLWIYKKKETKRIAP